MNTGDRVLSVDGREREKRRKKKRKRIVIFLIVNLYRVSEKKKKLIGQSNRINEFNGIEFKIEMAD